jgi:phosphate transport system permease protein
MSISLIVLLVLVLAAAAFVLCRARVLAMAGGNARNLHSLPHYYGWSGALTVILPAFLALFVWLVAFPVYVENQSAAALPDSAIPDGSTRDLVMSDVRRVAAGLDAAVAQGLLTDVDADRIRAEFTNIRDALGRAGVALGSDVTPPVLLAGKVYRDLSNTGALIRSALVLAVAIGGFLIALRSMRPDFRARNRVERVVLSLLFIASTIAILTTVGIVLSLLTESIRFFTQYPAQDFFFNLTWSPNFRGNSELGLIPLLWGTLYISIVAMLVAVPLGLFTAIYLAEYASKQVRNWVKPAIEVIAGIPSVVFGLFALVTVGPFLRDYFAEPFGLGNSGSSVMTAGLVIGIMNIPFVSSLADDIINAVPQAMRDGSYGLGATKSETIRQVVLPAALPGIMGAVLMAASRAIGETMIVTMGAGAAAALDLNPFQAMTTITVKIVSQLTGDTDFTSPETLVAFALGLTLFVITLGLNVLALQIVRRYREQYE